MNAALRVPRVSLHAALSLLAAWVWILDSSPGLSHQYWLAPSCYAAASGETIEIGAAVGTGFRGNRVPWSRSRAVRFVARASGVVDLAEGAPAGGAVWARFSASDPGGVVIAFESSFRPVELPGGEFDAYLHEEGLDEPLRARAARRTDEDGPVRELFRRCAKAWIAGDDASRVTTPMGLPLEIVPERAPGAHANLPVRVLAGGIPASNALVKAWRSPPGRSGRIRDHESRDSTECAWSGRTDGRGRVVIPTAEEGEWLVSVVRIEPCRDLDRADWESTWASFTFERRSMRRTADRP